jgi:hypothetical protein
MRAKQFILSESPRTNFWFSPGFDSDIKNYILTNQFPNACLACQDEVYRWAKKLAKSGIESEIHHGFYYPNGDYDSPEGHSWLEIEGSIFDPTAGQFDDYGEGEYETHEID